MNILPRPLVDWFRSVRQRFFMAAIRVTAEEAAADLEAEAVAVMKRRVTATFEAIDFARQLATEDEDKAAVLAAFKADLLEVRNISASVLSGRIPLEEGLEDLRTHPIASGGSATSLPDGSDSEGRLGLELEPKSVPITPPSEGTPGGSPASEPPRRPRGRPPGSKNRPKAEQGGQNGHVMTPDPEVH